MLCPIIKGTPPDLTDSDEIIANTELFWSCLYKRYDSHVPCQRHYLERLAECVTKVPPEVMAQLAEPLTVEEVITAIESLKKGKVSGPNGIHAELYIELAEEWPPLLQQQLNACFATNHCMSELQRRGRISQLFKSGLRSDPANYRPVCSLNNPEMGEYVVTRERDAAHQDEAITSGLRLGLVAGRCWMGDTQDAGIWVEKLEYSELYRGFVQPPRRGRRPSSVGRRRLIDRSS